MFRFFKNLWYGDIWCDVNGDKICPKKSRLSIDDEGCITSRFIRNLECCKIENVEKPMSAPNVLVEGKTRNAKKKDTGKRPIAPPPSIKSRVKKKK